MEVTLEQKIIIVMLFDGWVKFTDNFIGYENPDTLESLTEKGLSRKIQFDHKFYHNSYDYLMSAWEKVDAKLNEIMHDTDHEQDAINHHNAIGNKIGWGHDITEAFTALYDGITFLNNLNDKTK